MTLSGSESPPGHCPWSRWRCASLASLTPLAIIIHNYFPPLRLGWLQPWLHPLNNNDDGDDNKVSNSYYLIINHRWTPWRSLLMSSTASTGCGRRLNWAKTLSNLSKMSSQHPSCELGLTSKFMITIMKIVKIMGVFTWTRITFRKTFRNVIQNVIGIVIWTTCVYMGYKRLSNHDQELRTASDILLLLRSPRALIDPCAYAWLQRAVLKCTRTNHVPKELCVYMD